MAAMQHANSSAERGAVQGALTLNKQFLRITQVSRSLILSSYNKPL